MGEPISLSEVFGNLISNIYSLIITLLFYVLPSLAVLVILIYAALACGERRSMRNCNCNCNTANRDERERAHKRIPEPKVEVTCPIDNNAQQEQQSQSSNKNQQPICEPDSIIDSGSDTKNYELKVEEITVTTSVPLLKPTVEPTELALRRETNSLNATALSPDFRMKRLEKQNWSLVKQNIVLEKQIVRAVKAIADLERALKKCVDADNQEARSKLLEVENQQARVKALEKENTDLKIDSTNARKRAHKCIETRDAKVKALQAQLTSIRESEKQKDLRIAELRREAQLSDEMSFHTLQNLEEIGTLVENQESRLLDAEIVSQTSRVQELETENARLLQETTKQVDRIIDLEDALRSTKQSWELREQTQQNDIETLTSQVYQWIDKANQLGGKYNELEGAYKQIVYGRDEALATLRSLQDQMKRLTAQLTLRNDSIKRLRGELALYRQNTAHQDQHRKPRETQLARLRRAAADSTSARCTAPAERFDALQIQLDNWDVEIAELRGKLGGKAVEETFYSPTEG